MWNEQPVRDKLLIFEEKHGSEYWLFSDEKEKSKILRQKYLERCEQGYYDKNDVGLEFDQSIIFMIHRNSFIYEYGYEMFYTVEPKTLDD